MGRRVFLLQELLSKKLLEVAKRGVEIYIEETEERGLRYIQEHYK